MNPKTREQKTAQEALDIASAALAVAGHEITDDYSNLILLEVAEGKLSAEDAIELFKMNHSSEELFNIAS